jgi:hypothetical protein
MRLRRKISLVLVIVIMVGAAAFLLSNYSRAAGELSELKERLSSAQTRVPGLISQKESLESQLAQATSSLGVARAKFPRSVESIEYDEGLCKTAVESGVQITRLTTSTPSDRKVGDITYSVASAVVVVTGDIRSILSFVHALRTGMHFEPPWSAEVTSVNLVYSGQATINLNIHGYKG